MNTYTHTFWSQCPADGESIEYTLRISHSAMIRVEDILAACDCGPNFHEILADLLAMQIPGEHTITARHQGVLVETIRHGAPK